MSSSDLIIIALFLITVVYVVNRAIDSVDQQTKIALDETKNTPTNLNEQLEKQTLGDIPLKDVVKVSFALKPETRYKFDNQPKELGISVENISNKLDRLIYVYVDWDRSTITDYGNTARRVIQLNSDKQITDVNPPKHQVPSLVTPGTKLSANITAEPLLEQKDNAWKPKAPILDLLKLKAESKNKNIPKAVRDKLEEQWVNFEERKKPLEFYLRLMLRMEDLTDNVAKEYSYVLWCKLIVKNMHWTDQLPWNPKK